MTYVEVSSKAEIIKQQTKQLHLESEKILIPRLKGITNKNDYISILKMFYGYFQPLSEIIEERIDKNSLPDIEHRRKTSLLQNDLFQLGYTGNPDICRDLPTIHHPLQAYGALYVIEGSTLGGKIIAKMLKENSAWTADDSTLSYFLNYKDNTLQMWHSFKLSLEQAIRTEEDLGVVISSANDTFSKLKSWMLNYN